MVNDLTLNVPDLLIRPYPATTEGSTGYLFRLAEANFLRPRDLIEMGITLQPGVLSQHQLLPKAALFPELHAHVARMHTLRSEQSAIWNQRYARFCPLCLIVEPIWQASWEVFFFDACPHHGGWLINQCSTCGEHPWTIPRQEVYSLIEIGEELPLVNTIDERQIAFTHVLKFWQWNADEVVSVIEAVRDGKLQLQGHWIGASGVVRWVFDRAELQRWHQALDKGRANWVTIPEFAELLGVKQQVAYWLTLNGYIPSIKLGSKKQLGSRVKKKDIDRFLRRYIFGTEIADRIGRSPRKAMHMLADTNIYPLRSQNGDPCRQTVYTRSEMLDRFLARYSVISEEEALAIRGTTRRREKAWERIIYENGTDQPDESHFCLD